jgi:long-chain acyl-CoA synthetase
VIASGYYRIYPEDVEHALVELPGVAEAAVIGLPHAELGQVVCACIVRSAGSHISEDEVRAVLQSRLAHYQIPAQIHFD